MTNAFTPPTGGSNFLFALRAADSSTGVGGKYCAVAGVNPIAGAKKGGVISAVMKKYTAGAGFAPFIALLNGTDVSSANGYILGLSDDASYQIILKKGSISSGLSVSDSTNLRESTAAYTDSGDAASLTAGWFHLRLDVIVNPHGGVVLRARRNTANVTTPSWAAIPGMDDYLDDAVGVLTGTTPYLNGFQCIFGHYTQSTSGSVSFFDHIRCAAQVNP